MMTPFYIMIVLGLSVFQSKQQPTSDDLAGNFRDVPQSHWAARSVWILKKEGILHGYPEDQSGKND